MSESGSNRSSDGPFPSAADTPPPRVTPPAPAPTDAECEALMPSEADMDLTELFAPPTGPLNFTGPPSLPEDPTDILGLVLNRPEADSAPASGVFTPPPGEEPVDGGSDVLRNTVFPPPGSSNIFDGPMPSGVNTFGMTKGGDSGIAFGMNPAGDSHAGFRPIEDSLSGADFDVSSRTANQLLRDLADSKPGNPDESDGGPDFNRVNHGSSGSYLFGEPTESELSLPDAEVDLSNPDPDQLSFSGPESSIFAGNVPPNEDASLIRKERFDAPTSHADGLLLDGSLGSDDDLFLADLAPPQGGEVSFDLPNASGRRPSGESHRTDESGVIDWSISDHDAQVSARITEAEAGNLGIPDLASLSGAGALVDGTDFDTPAMNAATAPLSTIATRTQPPSGSPVTTTLTNPSLNTRIVQGSSRSSSGWLGGTVLGLLAGLGMSAAAYFGLNPATPAKPVAGPTGAVVPLTPANLSAKNALADARNAIANGGDPAATLAALEAAGPNPAVPIRADRGKARWQARIRELATSGKPVAPNDLVLKEALVDFAAVISATGNSQSPEEIRAGVDAVLHLGLTRELTGDRPGAIDAYTSGVTKFPAFKAVFETALARLALTQPAAALPPRAALDLTAAATLTVLLLTPPDAEAPGAVPAEAGFQFWTAATQAAAGDYAAARTAIQAARAAHEARRLRFAGRGLNPLSDPLEQIFTRCCDDLAEYYTFQEATYSHPTAGPLVKQFGVKKGLDRLVALTQANPTDMMTLQKLAELQQVAAEKDKTLAAVQKQLQDALATAEQSGTVGKQAAAKLLTLEQMLAAERAALAVARKDAETARAAQQQADVAVAELRAEMKGLQARPADPRPADPRPEPNVNPEADVRLTQAEAAAEAAKTALAVAEQKARTAQADADKATADAAQALAALEKRLEAQAQTRVAAVEAEARKRLSATQAELEAQLLRERANHDAERQQLVDARRRAEQAAATARDRAAAAVAGRPVPTPTPTDALTAQARLAAGLDAYFSGRYAQAEAALSDATTLDGTDARAWYFLGLTRLATGQDATSDFARGADLERRGSPNVRTINAMLERVQGSARKAIQAYRP